MFWDGPEQASHVVFSSAHPWSLQKLANRVGLTPFLWTTASAWTIAARHLVVLDRDPKIVMISDSVS